MEEKEQQIKSKSRVSERGEVFTAKREVNAMLDLVKRETMRTDSRFLEPACGNGNFLAEILRRKLKAAERQSVPPRKKRPIAREFERKSVLSVSSVYGVDILLDNIESCRKRLFDIWKNEYKRVCLVQPDENCEKTVKFILKRNIVCGNALSMKKVDSNGNDTEQPIVFSEWTFISESKMQRKDFVFDKLLSGEYDAKKIEERKSQNSSFVQGELFPNLSAQQELFPLSSFQNENKEEESEKTDDEGEFVFSCVSDYRRLWEYDK